MTSCQVSEKWKTGPVTAHATIMRHARAKVDARPHCREVHWAAVLNEALNENGRSLELSGKSDKTLLLPE
jgi:hypothetical protein